MAWEQFKFGIINRLRQTTDFKPDTFGSKSFTEFGGWIWAEFGELKEEVIPENMPLGQKFLMYIEFNKPDWTLESAQKWFEENEQTILDKLSVNTDSPKRTVVRYDVGRMGKTEITSQGYLKTDGILTRTGVFIYHKADGSEFRELRLAEDVFDEKSMQSFGNLAVTDSHPSQMLDSRNTKDFSVGHTLPEIKKDGDHIRASLLITDEGMIRKIKDGKDKISNGYTCDLELVTGEFNGEKYDAIQRNILGNHVAIVDNPRGGLSCRLTMDSDNDADIAFMVDSDLHINSQSKNNKKEKITMAKITLDGIETEMPDAPASIVAAAIGKRDSKIEELEESRKTKAAELDALQGKFDSTEAKLKEAEENKLDEEAVGKLVEDRAKSKLILLNTASQLLTDADYEKLDGASDKEIMLAVIAADPVLGKISLDEKSDDYISAIFESAVESAKSRGSKADGQTKDVGISRTEPAKDEAPDSEKARQDAINKIKSGVNISDKEED